MKLNLLVLLLLPIGGCQHLLYVHDASFGVNITASTSEGTGKLNLGYESETFAIVPRFTPQSATGQQIKSKAEAMSLVSVSNVDATGLTEVIFNHVILTGQAAKAARAAAGDLSINTAIGALSGQGLSKPSTNRLAILALTFDQLKTLSAGGDAQAKAILDKLDGVASSLPATYPATLYQRNVDRMTSKTVNLTVTIDKGDPVPPAAPPAHAFQAVMDYANQLQSSIDALTAARTDYNAGTQLPVISKAGVTIATFDQSGAGKQLAGMFFDQSIQSANTAQQAIDKVIANSGILDAVAALIGKSH